MSVRLRIDPKLAPWSAALLLALSLLGCGSEPVAHDAAGTGGAVFPAATGAVIAGAMESGGASSVDAGTMLVMQPPVAELDASVQSSTVADAAAALDAGVDASDIADSSMACTGRIHYELSRSSSPTNEEQAAYDLIVAALDAALDYYNCYADFEKDLYVSFEPLVATADGNPNGSIRFGSTESMNYITAMHEISHTLGVGDNNWDAMIQNGVFPGTHATAQLRAITGISDDEVHGDNQHFWPYGLNFTSEVMSEQDLINHCLMVTAIRQDLGY